MSLRTLIFGNPVHVAIQAQKDKAFEQADDRLKEMAARREEMRQKLSAAMREIIKDNAQ